LLFATILASSALLTGVLLDPVGGTPSIWGASLLVWQTAALAGCAYAFALSRWLSWGAQVLLHVVVLGLSLAVWFLAPLPTVDPDSTNLWSMIGVRGLPFFVVAGGILLLQRWFADTAHPEGPDPYFLNAAGALGSMLGLLVVWLPFGAGWWRWGAVVAVALQFACIAMLRPRSAPATIGLEIHQRLALAVLRRLAWAARSAVALSLLLGLCTHLSTEVAPIPVVNYLVPLAVYLSAFGRAFARTSSRSAAPLAVSLLTQAFGVLVLFALILLPIWIFLLQLWEILALVGIGLPAVVVLLLPWRPLALVQPVLALALIAMLPANSWPVPFYWVYAAHLLVFTLTVRVLFAAQVHDRPPASQLPEFFFWVATGGMVGGLFNVLVAPLLFTTIVEYPLALVLSFLLWPYEEMRRYLASFASARE